MKKLLTSALTSMALTFSAVADAEPTIESLSAKVAELQAIVDAHKAERATTAKQLALFDEMDLEAFNSRDMKRISEIHHDDVVVHLSMMPADKTTKGFDPVHKADLQYLFDQFDYQIPTHTVSFGHGEWTAGISISTGKFVRPITLPNGVVHEPNGRGFEVQVATIARWKEGRIVEEYVFWDQDSVYRQIGLYD